MNGFLIMKIQVFINENVVIHKAIFDNPEEPKISALCRWKSGPTALPSPYRATPSQGVCTVA